MTNTDVKSLIPEHPIWEKCKITRLNKKFDQKYFNDRRKYLIELDEIVAATLQKEDWYDRTRFLSEIEGHDMIRKNKQCHGQGSDEKVQPRAPYSRVRPYKEWVHDS